MKDLIAFAFLAIALVALPVGAWHTATFNSPGILAGVLGVIVLAWFAAALAD